MLNFLEILGPLVVGWAFIIGLIAIPLSLLLLILYLRKSKASKAVATKSKTKETTDLSNEVIGEVHYELGENTIIFTNVGDVWESRYKVGNHESKLDIPASKTVGDAFWAALTHLRVPPEVLA